jgi:hypothetical protein
VAGNDGVGVGGAVGSGTLGSGRLGSGKLGSGRLGLAVGVADGFGVELGLALGLGLGDGVGAGVTVTSSGVPALSASVQSNWMCAWFCQAKLPGAVGRAWIVKVTHANGPRPPPGVLTWTTTACPSMLELQDCPFEATGAPTASITNDDGRSTSRQPSGCSDTRAFWAVSVNAVN